MSRQMFLTIASLIAIIVGVFAFSFPGVLLESKGVAPVAATMVWVKEVGVLLVAMGVIAFVVRNHEGNPTLKALLFGNIIIQAGLFFIELVAYNNGTITKLSGIVPNLALHMLLAGGFFYFWLMMGISAQKKKNKRGEEATHSYGCKK